MASCVTLVFGVQDYIILSKALANRLREAMEQILHQDQMYYVPGRSMEDNIDLIWDISEVSSLLGIDSGLMYVRQGKDISVSVC